MRPVTAIGVTVIVVAAPAAEAAARLEPAGLGPQLVKEGAQFSIVCNHIAHRTSGTIHSIDITPHGETGALGA